MTVMNEIEIKESEDDVSSENNSEVEDSDVVDEDNDNSLANAGWADAISKILKQKSKKKTVVLSKAKKITDVKKVKKESLGFEIETAGVVKEVKEDSSDDTKDIKQESGEPARKKKKELPNLRVKPDILDISRERILQKIATKGVVQLFNAVKSQQKDITKKLEEAGPLEVRKEKVLKNIDKRAFLDVLMGEKSQRVEADVTEKKEKKENTDKDVTWSVLKEDFMMGAKMKDWDKELEKEIESD